MKTLTQKLFLLLLLAISVTAIIFGQPQTPAKAAFNGVMNYQGKLTNSSNVAVADGTYNMEFKLYDDLSAGNLLWTETRTGGNKVQVTNGIFSVMLGEVASFSSFDFNKTLFLSVNIGGTGSPSWDGPMTPRKKLGAVPVAFLASNLKGEGVIDITNTSSPQATLNYDGLNKLTVGVANDGFTTLTAVGSGAGFNLTGGNVGIGSATASAKLHVTATTEQLRIGFDAGNYTSFTTSAGGDLTIAPSGSDLAITGNVDLSGTLTSGTADAFVVNSSGVITSGGYQGAAITPGYGGTGIASYTVGDLLYASGGTTLSKLAGVATGNVLISGGVSTAPSWGKVALGTHTTGNYVADLTGTANQISASASTGSITLSIPSDFRAPGTLNAVTSIATGAGAGTVRIDSSGNLLNIGTIDSGLINGQTISSAANFDGTLAVAGYTGIGTTNPLYQLHVFQSVPTGSAPVDVFAIEAFPNDVASDYRDIGFGPSMLFKDAGALTVDMARIAAQYEDTNGFHARLAFSTGLNNVLTERMTILNDGYVGIGTSSPNSLLSVGASSQFTINGSGAITGVVGITNTGSYTQSGTGTFGTGTGAVSLNGDVTIASGKTLYLNGSPALKVDTAQNSWFVAGASGSPSAGAANVGVGFQALNSCSTGCNNNLAFGAYALWQNTSGYSNAAFGSSALVQNALGYGNVGVGREALQGNKDGSNNVAIGYNAMRYFNYDAATAAETYNVAIGANAGYGVNGSTTGVKSTFIGYNAGYDYTTADLNTIIGYNSGRGLTTGGKNTIIGAQVTGLTAGTANNIILADGDGNIKARYNDSTGVLDSWTLAGTVNVTNGVSIGALQGYTGAGAVTLSSGGAAGLTIDSASGRTIIATGDFLNTGVSGVSGAAAGDIWYDTAANKYKINENGTTKILCNTTDAGCGAGGGGARLDQITAATTGSISIDSTNKDITWDWSTLTSENALTLSGSGTGLTSGSVLKVSSATTGAVTNGIVQLLGSANFSGSGGLFNATANSTTAGVVAKFSGTSLTTGTGVSMVGGTAMTTGSVLNVNSTTYVHTTAETGNLAKLQFTDASTNTTGTSVTNGLDIAATINTSGAGTKQINALNIDAPTVTACTTGACTYKGLNITGGTGSIAGMTSYGAYIDAGTGSGTEYAAAFMNGNVGIGTAAPLSMLQVGSAINRGDITVYGDISTLGAVNLTAIAGIKDVFVYDTTADSDGGRWIDWATTEQLSWYTETKDATGSLCNISSNDRCGTSSFPRKATLVVTTSALYIFDNSNNTLWMKFSQDASGYALGVNTSNDPSSVTALNGVIYVGTTDGAGGAGDGLFAFDFINDRMWNYDATDRSAADVGIGSRNGAVVYNTNNDTTLDIATVGTLAGWETINDVFAVTPNITITASAIGAATNATPGYGNTYVGLATNSGVTIININQGKLVQYSDATDNDYTAVHLTKTGRMYALNTTLDQLERWDNYDSDGPRATRVNGAYSAVWDQTTTPALSKTQPDMTVGAPDALDVIERASSALETEDLIYVGHSLGMTEIHGHTTTAAGWVKWYDTTRQTMLQPHYNDVALPLDETSGTVADSATIVDNDMTYKGTYTLGASGVRGKGVNLGGAGYLCSDTTNDGTCDADAIWNMSTVGWTTTMWFNHTTATPGAPEVLFDKCYVPATFAQAVGCVQAYMTTGGLIGVGIDDDATWTIGSSYDITATSVNRYNDGQWHMLTMSRTNAGDLDVYIDGNALNLSNATGLATTVDNGQIVALGAACNVSANCATAGNFWNGSIDDFTYAIQTTTLATLTNAQQRRLYNDARPLANKRVITVTNATTATSTTIGDSGESWQPNEFAGLIVTLTSDTGSGQTRRVTSNTATVLTVSPAFDTVPDTTTDFEVDPEALYGSSDIVTAVGITNKALLGEARLLCAGTDSTTGTGGVTCYNHQAGPNVIADIYHGDAKKTDDIGTEWTDTDTDSDDIRAIDLSKRGIVIATDEHIWSQAENVQLGQSMDYLINQLYVLRNELVLDGVTVAGSTGMEIGFTGGADLAEYYNSTDSLRAGDVVAIDPNGDGDDVIRYTGDSSQQVMGVVASKPAIILGEKLADGYPIALTGRIPVNFSNENGEVKPGDYIAPSSIEGHAMRATGAGVVLGKALAASNTEANSEVCNSTEEPDIPTEVVEEEPETTDPENPEDAPEEPPVFDTEMCGKVMMFVELGSFPGLSVEQLMEEMEISLADATLNELPDEDALLSDETKQDKILAFLKQMKTQKEETGVSSQILTDRLSATFEVISPSLVAEGLQVTTIGTDGRSIQILGDLEFIGRPYLNSDSGGFAKITTGARYVDIEFEREYVEQPTVNVTVTLDEDGRLADENDETIIESIHTLQDAQTEQLFGSNIQFLVTRKSVKGFRIIINQPAPQDITFSWLALAVKQPRLTISEPVDNIDPVDEVVPSDEEIDTTPVDEDNANTENNNDSNNEVDQNVVDSPPSEVDQTDTIVPDSSPLPDEPVVDEQDSAVGLE